MTKPHALVVDDDPMLVEVFSMALNMVGFEVEGLTDPSIVIDHMLGRLPVLLTLDMQMPGLSGAALLSQIRADSRFDAVKVIMISANSQLTADERVAEADIVLTKPVYLYQITEIARRLIGAQV